jgi:hypothetical protein
MWDRAAMLLGLQPPLQRPVLPILVVDFHYVIHQMGTEDLSFVVNQKFSQALFDTVQLFGYVGTFQVLFPPLGNFPGLVEVNPFPTLTVSTVPTKKITRAEKKRPTFQCRFKL